MNGRIKGHKEATALLRLLINYTKYYLFENRFLERECLARILI